MRNVSTTFQARFQTDSGNVIVEQIDKRQWKVWPVGHMPIIASSKAEAMRMANDIDRAWLDIHDARPGGKSRLPKDAQGMTSSVDLEREINAFLAGYRKGRR
jgi:hypothetical protein